MVPDMDELSGKQKRVYLYIKSYIEENGYPPTVREICEAVQVKSTSTAHGYLTRLEKKGFIKRDTSRPRAIGLLDESAYTRANVMSIPVVGKVTAGEPILATENVEEYLPLPSSFVRDENSFILTVQGESMIDAGIQDGDFLVVRRQNYADDGDIVVALLGEEATVKRFYLEGRRVRLQPENPTMDPIILPVNEVQVLGKVSGLLRRVC